MRNNQLKLLLIFSVFLLLPINSCEGPTGPQGPPGTSGDPGPKIIGKLSGKDLLFNAAVLYDDHSGVEVKVDGTNYNTITDIDGKWSIDSLPTGTYNITITKVGFGSYKYTSFQFTGGGDYFIGNRYLYLSKDLPISFNSVSLGEDQYDKYVALSGTLTQGVNPPAWGYNILVFVSSFDSVSSLPGFYDLLFTEPYVWQISPGTFSGGIYYSALNKVGIDIGDRIYLVCYTSADYVNTFGYFNYEYFRYIDPITGGYNYTNLGNASNVLSIQLE